MVITRTQRLNTVTKSCVHDVALMVQKLAFGSETQPSGYTAAIQDE